ncbi:MAG: ATP-dependent RecD-like DNA helicase [Candidatus Lambdaproteobacteria bacterium]|nr:ATP-dependent RecD-like DNA helicase [Candidatus Lambdaproteobacteria bacterium]
MTAPTAGTETLEGILEHITYQNPESGFLVGRLQPEGARQTVTVRGAMFNVREGQTVKVWGRWEEHRDYGLQFDVKEFLVIEPTSLEGMQRFLSSMVKGIGEKTAERIVKAFGAETFQVIDATPDRLREVPKVSGAMLASLKAAWAEHKALRDIMPFLYGQGISPHFADKIFKTYGFSAVEVIRENPYRLAMDIERIGFRTADLIARRMGMPLDAPQRAEAGLLHVLDEMIGQGHVGMPREELVAQAAQVLEIDPRIVQGAVQTLLGDGLLRLYEDAGGEPPCLFRPRYERAEASIVKHLLRIQRGAAFSTFRDVAARLDALEKASGLYLADEQRAAVHAALNDKVLIITGGPGTGKTTILRFILGLAADTIPDMALAAPTGKAARRLADACGRPASTIHRLLEAGQGGFNRDADRRLTAELLIVDESSMIDTLLMAALLAALPDHARLVLVGDIDQLPSVGAGMVLHDLIASGRIPVVRLERIFRQSERSRITANAHRIRKGEAPDLALPPGEDLADFYFMPEPDPARIVEKIVTLVTERIPQRFGLDPMNDVQVLTPMHKGLTGALHLNRVLQQTLNAHGAELRRARGPAPAEQGGARGPAPAEQGEARFRVGDRVMQIRNDYDKDVFNGDVGAIRAYDADSETAVIVFDERPVVYERKELDDLALAYAITVHKAQGSEFPAVVIPLTTQHAIMLQRNLLYTALTRGRRLAVIIGTEKAVRMAVHNARPVVRHTRLRQRLLAAVGDTPAAGTATA